MKPKRKYDNTITFYRDILKLNVLENNITNRIVSRTHKGNFDNISLDHRSCGNSIYLF